jgi:CubicO group peptidase (beta-lactamase class C family)
MTTLRRRDFNTALLWAGASARSLFAATTSIEDTLKEGLNKRKIPSAVAMAATADKITYTGAFGKRDQAATKALTPDAIFAIASMTKAVTTAAAMQLVEKGKLSLDDPASKILPDLGKVEVLYGWDAGKPVLKPATKPVTLRNLMTHTSGFCYAIWDKDMYEYQSKVGGPGIGVVAPLTPLMFEPGTRWQYGVGVDWTGKLVEAVSGLSLEDYFQKNLLGPLGMKDTSFILQPEKFDRLVANHQRQPDGSLKENPRTQPAPPKAYNGGGGLYSTAADYVRFMQMILNQGVGPGGQRLLEAKTVSMMASNQTGSLQAGKMGSFQPNVSSDVDFHKGESDRYTFGFLLNQKAYPGGRSAGSLAWAGIDNTYYWIDPAKKVCGVLMMQFLPFADKEAVSVLGEFERAVYAA